jgi:hypothetical protein
MTGGAAHENKAKLSPVVSISFFIADKNLVIGRHSGQANNHSILAVLLGICFLLEALKEPLGWTGLLVVALAKMGRREMGVDRIRRDFIAVVCVKKKRDANS